MYKTLKMMKSIVKGNEGKVDERELIEQYQERLSPNILAYFYVNNFGLILNTSKKYPMLLCEDIASFCLQELDLSLQNFDEKRNVKFITYFMHRLDTRLKLERKLLLCNNKKANIDTETILDYENKLYTDNIDIFDLNEYKLSSKEKNFCKLILDGFTIKQIAKRLNVSVQYVYQIRKKLQNKFEYLV